MSFDIRETRLRNDYQRVRDLANRSDLIHITVSYTHLDVYKRQALHLLRRVTRNVRRTAEGASHGEARRCIALS